MHDKDVNQQSIDQTSANLGKEERKKIFRKKANKTDSYMVKTQKKFKTSAASPEIELENKSDREDEKREPSSQDKIVREIEESFKADGAPPKTTVDFYRAGKILGKGAFGKVSLALHKLSKKLVALKLLNKEFLKNETSKAKVMQEVDILIRFRHPNVVKLFETFESNKHIIVVMEL